ncbi:outer membrane transport energization protein TonB [Bacteroides heparinolyticus]|uniref:Outer membrane transport energization protein TonB n=4 Tax=Prevotella heparinolytica TaxID=28113 RepID=A0A449I0R4_9BACE|nr:M56 family metallopeptidase [Bacteroides heparinolyticus]VFB12937.1 outer membrane transport energization protein TonB [Bacteroides heparinolyticus]
MGLFFVYILKSSVCLAAFYLFYRLLMARETFHRFNRFALLGILLLSCLLPLIEVNVKQEPEVRQTMLTLGQLLMMADAESSATVGSVEEATVTWVQMALLAYLSGILFFAFRNACSLMRLLMLLKSGSRQHVDCYLPGRREHVTLIVHNKEVAPFSWMKYIVISRKDLEENGREILIHELAHIRNRHSLDLLVADVCVFFQWFNPASWLMKQELQNIHEYEADEAVIEEGVDAKQYQLLLIKKAVGTRLYSMANSFNHSKLKKRITMMLKERSSPWACLKYLYVLPVAAVAVTAFARPEVSEKVEEISAVKVNDLAAIVETKVAESVGDTTKPAGVTYVPVEVNEKLKGTPVLTVVEQMPAYPGGMAALMEYFKENMRYPASAKERGLQGRVTVQFVVDKDGSIKKPKVIRSIDQELDEEALRLVKSMSKWEPGRQNGEPVAVKFAVPVPFKLDADVRMSEQLVIQEVRTSMDGGRGIPLYIVDGKEVSASVMRALKPESIAGVSVLKDKSATAIYGERAKHGVVVITLKEGDSAIDMPEKKPEGAGKDGKDIDLSKVEVFIDGVKVDLQEKKLDELVPSDKIENIKVDKASDGKGKIYITIKKGEKVHNLYAVQGNMKVEGKVVDEKGEPIIGATVLIEGTNRGSVTDVDGKFVLSVPDKNAVLVISYIGMATVKVTAQPEVTVALKKE